MAPISDALFVDYIFYGIPIVLVAAVAAIVSYRYRLLTASMAASVVMMAAIPMTAMALAYLDNGGTLESLGSYLSMATTLRLISPAMVSGFVCACWCFKRVVVPAVHSAGPSANIL
jgi:hypothetical protein